MKLRPYQKECIEAVERAGNGRWLCQLATGMGKTVIFANIPLGGKTLLLSHRQELVHQPLKYFTCDTAVEMGKDKADKSNAQVISASVQTLSRRLSNYSSTEFHTIIVDEAHHAASSTYRKILDHFTPERVIGFTATPNRSDGLGLESVFDRIIFKKDLKWGIENGFLSPIQCRRVNIGYDIAGVSTRMGDYSPSELGRVVNVESCNKAIAEVVRNIAEPPVLIFAVDVAHAEAIAKCIPGAVSLSAESKDRSEVVEAYKRGEVKVLVNCALFTEGTDLPNTRTVIIARPTKSAGLYTQMVGRGTRLAEGKTHCLLIDCVGVSSTPICTAPSLLGLDLDSVPQRYQADIEGDLLDDLPDMIQVKADTPESWINNCKIVDLWAKGMGYILHDVNWQKKPDGALVVHLPKKKWLRISAPDLTGNAELTTSGGYKVYCEAQELYDMAFNMLRSQFMDQRPLWSLSSAKRWGSAPASEKQLMYIERLARQKKVDLSGVGDLTKLQATNILNRLKD